MLKCSFEDGNSTSLRHCVVDVLVLRDSKILLEKRTGKILEGGKWSLVGGYVERDETLVQAVRREIKEETGYEVERIQLLKIRDNPNRPHEDRQNISFVFVCRAGTKHGASDWEVDDLQWFDLNNLPPKSEFAFDHYENIELYLRAIADGLTPPVVLTI